jgi:magnesium-protoporphyrin O-methyltransferase
MELVDDKAVVKEYFNNTGFDRWQRIYGDGEVNKVHTLLEWFEADNNLEGLSICDAGCGVGSLSIPLATAKASVDASDISEKMVGEAKEIAAKLFGNNNNPKFSVQDLESLSGSYHTVVCLDVLIHYPQAKAAEMISHLASLAQSRLIISFAPKTPCLSLLKKIGSFFPGASKATRSYLHTEADIIEILEAQGFTIKRKALTKKSVYFSQMLEAVK